MAMEQDCGIQAHALCADKWSDHTEFGTSLTLSPGGGVYILQCDHMIAITERPPEELFSDWYTFRTATQHLSAAAFVYHG